MSEQAEIEKLVADNIRLQAENAELREKLRPKDITLVERHNYALFLDSERKRLEAQLATSYAKGREDALREALKAISEIPISMDNSGLSDAYDKVRSLFTIKPELEVCYHDADETNHCKLCGCKTCPECGGEVIDFSKPPFNFKPITEDKQ